MDAHGKKKKVLIPAGEIPAVAMLYKFGRANILEGRPPFDPTFIWEPVPYCDNAELQRAQAEYGWDGRLKCRMVPEQFAKMLAKIGYSYAIAEVGFAAFDPLCLDIIRGKAKNYSYVVGGSFELKRAPDSTSDHFIALGMIDQPHRPKLVIVHIRLFQQMGTPHHYVVVGRVQTEAQIARMQKYFSDGGAVQQSWPGV
jgi:hypothetical protein